MAYFDHKQKKLINSWNLLSHKADDAYTAFMAQWIAFNAICYNLYVEKATIDRANIDRGKSKSGLTRIHNSLSLKGEIQVEKAKISLSRERWNVDLSLPESRLFISVTNNYTEDIIFSEFVKDNGEWYASSPSADFINLKASLRKGARHYVINMAKSDQYDDAGNIDEMAKKSIIKLCEENNLKTIVSVLYQIRCNIFHGEKTPGDINDDRVVKGALPVLKYCVSHLIGVYSIDVVD